MCRAIGAIEERTQCLPDMKHDIKRLERSVYKAMGGASVLSVLGTIVLKKLGVL
jgi:hypothetical protein